MSAPSESRHAEIEGHPHGPNDPIPTIKFVGRDGVRYETYWPCCMSALGMLPLPPREVVDLATNRIVDKETGQ